MVEYSDVPFHLLILNKAKDYWDDVALTDAKTETKLRFRDVYTKAYQCATVLQNAGAKKGDIICVALPNCIEFPIIFLGAALIGCSISGINPAATKHEMKHYLALTKSKIIIATSKINEVLKSFEEEYIVITSNKAKNEELNFDMLLKNVGLNFKTDFNVTISIDDTLITPFSSGTSGPPKCVQLTHRNYNCATASLRRAVFDQLSLGGRRTTLAFLPFFHGSGFWALCFCLLDGHHSVILDSFQPAFMLRCIEKYKVDTINVVPAIITYLCKNINFCRKFDFSSVTTVLCGSAALGSKLSQEFLKFFPHVKHLLQGSEIDKLNTNGELCIKSDAVMKGYYNDEAATLAAIDKDGWLHTGDVVYRNDKDYYYVVDRLKELIKVNGLQVSPSELESILMSYAGVVDAAVVGIPNSSSGEVPAAVVQLESNERSEKVLLEQLKHYFNERVAPYKQLKGGIRAVDKLPKTSTNKTIRNELTKYFS